VAAFHENHDWVAIYQFFDFLEDVRPEVLALEMLSEIGIFREVC
jgi:hypothetical protein